MAGAGSMKGVLAKLFTLFDQTGEAMDRASLVTCLSECLLIPNMALQDYIVWEEIDALHAKAAITHYGITAGGIFTFNENGEMLSFTTGDREAVAADGTSEKVKWTAVCSEYVETNGIKKPTVLKAIWHYDDGDLVYFDGKDVVIEFDTRE
jgi:L-rhamnose mutarotase